MIISIEGLPGCKKNAICKYFADQFNIKINCNMDTEFHNKFLQDPHKFVSAYEIDKLIKINDQHNQINVYYYKLFNNIYELCTLNNVNPEIAVPDLCVNPNDNSTSTKWKNLFLFNTTHAFYHVYIQHIYQNLKILSDTDYEIIGKLYKLLYKEPDYIIYLYGNKHTNYNRYVKNAFKPMSLIEYDQLEYLYEWVFDSINCHIPIYKVNIDDPFDTVTNNLSIILNKLEIIDKMNKSNQFFQYYNQVYNNTLSRNLINNTYNNRMMYNTNAHTDTNTFPFHSSSEEEDDS